MVEEIMHFHFWTVVLFLASATAISVPVTQLRPSMEADMTLYSVLVIFPLFSDVGCLS